MLAFLGRRIVRVATLLLVLAVAATGVACKDGGSKTFAGLIDVSGGEAFGPDGGGGPAGNVLLGVGHGRDSDIEVLVSGDVDASFTPTSGIVVDTGPRPLIVDGDVVVPLDPAVHPGAGEVYALSTHERLFISNGVDELGEQSEIATGIDVRPGATLELPLINFGTEGIYRFSHGIANEGVITAVDFEPMIRGGLQLFADGDYAGSGDIETFGELDGQAGGDFELEVAGSIFMSGNVRAHGADSPDGGGGTGGWITLRAEGGEPGGYIELTGELVARGGAGKGPNGSGGWGGRVYVASRSTLSVSSGIDARGGDGDQLGGAGVGVTLTVLESGDLLRSGDVHACGGNSIELDGGSGGDILLEVFGGDLRTRGDLHTNGGDTEAEIGLGGRGGEIELRTLPLAPGIVIVEAGDIWSAGDLSARGGRGGMRGGAGGAVVASVENSSAGVDESIRLRGYREIDGSGGDGELSGSNGLRMSILSGVFPRPASVPPAVVLPTGTTRVEPPIDGTGGDADPAVEGSVGGDGGRILSNDTGIDLGSYDLSGGAGFIPGFDGSVVFP